MMSKEKALKFFQDALDVVAAYHETAERIDVSYRIWEALNQEGLLDPSDPWKPSRVSFRGTRLVVRESYAPERVDVVTVEEAALLKVLEELRVRALRDTGVAPVAFELGSMKHALYQRASRGISMSFQGIPVKKVHKTADHIGVQFFAAPPDWCSLNACVSLKSNDMVWGKVVGIRTIDFKIIVRDLESDVEKEVSFREMRDEWQRIPDRIVPDSRFLRILRAASVSNLDE